VRSTSCFRSAHVVVWVPCRCWLSLLPSTVAVYSKAATSLTRWDAFGIALFSLGFAFETIADNQKWAKKQREMKGEAAKGKGDKAAKWMDEGLWRLCRYPNYFGEICVWSGLYAVAVPALYQAYGPKMVALGALSPAFVSSLLLFVSGVPLAEKRADKRFGDDPQYQEYKKSTPLIIPDLTKVFK